MAIEEESSFIALSRQTNEEFGSQYKKFKSIKSKVKELAQVTN